MSSQAYSGSNDCNLDISYLESDAILKYPFYESKKSWWLRGGLGFLYPVAKKSNVLDTEKMTLNEKFILSTGMTWQLRLNNFLPLNLEYTLQPSNSVITISQLSLRIGYGHNF